MAHQSKQLSLSEAIALVGELTDGKTASQELTQTLQDGALVAKAGMLVVQGRPQFNVPLPHIWWTAAATIDWSSSRGLLPFTDLDRPLRSATDTGGSWAEATDICIDRDAILSLWGKEAAMEPKPVKYAGNKVGRPASYDWEAFWIEVARIAELHGLPGAGNREGQQSDFVRQMLEWCSKEWGIHSLARDR